MVKINTLWAYYIVIEEVLIAVRSAVIFGRLIMKLVSM